MNFVTGIIVLYECCPSSGHPRSFHGGGEILEAWSVTRAVGFFLKQNQNYKPWGQAGACQQRGGHVHPNLRGHGAERLTPVSEATLPW